MEPHSMVNGTGGLVFLRIKSRYWAVSLTGV